MARTELTTEFYDLHVSHKKATEYSKSVEKQIRQARIEKTKEKLALSIIGGAFLSLPLFYGMLFIATLV